MNFGGAEYERAYLRAGGKANNAATQRAAPRVLRPEPPGGEPRPPFSRVLPPQRAQYPTAINKPASS
ncbi:unnamed protein product, partial [Iphiclides podalirius]